MTAPRTALSGRALLALAVAVGAGCRAARHAGPADVRTAAVLRYSGGLSGRPLGVRLWEAGREVRADGISASVTVSGRAGVQAASNARCRRSPAEERFRRAVDSVFTSLRRVRKRDS